MRCSERGDWLAAGSRGDGDEREVAVPAGDREDEGPRLQVADARDEYREEAAHQGKSGGERWAPAPSQTGVCVLHAYIKGSEEMSGGRPVKLVSAYCMRTSRAVRR